MSHADCGESLAAFLRRYPPSPRHWVAFSGGLDSTALLHLCHALRTIWPGFELAAAHIHHGLHADADRWTAFCAETCSALAVPLTIRQVDARPVGGASPEESARTARYAALSDLLGPGDTLLTAQHQDDQAETLLLQLFRGAGPAGLAAMPERTPFGPGFLVRPLLDCRRQDLHDYAARHQLNWIEDASNTDPRFDRNYLRHAILPLLEQRWPGLTGNIGRSARHCAEADGLLGEQAQELLAAVRDPLRNTLCVARLHAHSPPRQRLIVRAWLRDTGCVPPSTALMDRVLGELLPAGADRQPAIRWDGAQIRRFRGELHLLRAFGDLDAGTITDWDGITPLALGPDNGLLGARLEAGPGLDPERWRRGRITVRYRQGGETLRLPQRAGTRELKKLLQEAGVAPWLRTRMPLVYLDNELAAVADLWVNAPFAGDPRGTNVRLCWERPRLELDARHRPGRVAGACRKP